LFFLARLHQVDHEESLQRIKLLASSFVEVKRLGPGPYYKSKLKQLKSN